MAACRCVPSDAAGRSTQVRTKPQELVIGNIVRRVLAIVRSAHVDEGHVSVIRSREQRHP